jgi:hypothetical protein
MQEIPTGYQGQRYEVQFKDDPDGPWKVFGWQNMPVGGIVAAVAKWPQAIEMQVVEVSSTLRNLFVDGRRRK